MIGYIEGLVTHESPDMLYVDINGLGYEVRITLNTYQKVKGKKTVKLFTQLVIKEDEWIMYGFYDMDEKGAFQKLISVSGIGVNTARLILSTLTTNELLGIIENGDSKSFEKIKGIGAKTAQRIILELKGKLDLSNTEISGKENIPVYNTNKQDALKALVGLGIAKNMAENAVSKINSDDNTPVEVIIKEALKNI